MVVTNRLFLRTRSPLFRFSIVRVFLMLFLLDG